jgi:acyl dehydratase
MTASEINPEAMSKGYDRLRFIKPVFIGDTISVKVSIAALENARQPGHGIVTEQVEVTNQHGEIVLACAHLLLVRRRS